MSDLQPRITKKRVLGGISVFVVATAVLIPLGIDPVSYFTGVAAGIVGIGAVVAFIIWRRKKVRDQRV